MRVTDADGKAAIGTDGYFYFGAARELPGVRELFDVKNGPFARVGLDTHCLCFYPRGCPAAHCSRCTKGNTVRIIQED